MRDLFVKVCGLTRPADVVAAIEAGADAIGLSMVPRSPRRLNAQRASELAAVAKGRAQIVLLVEAAPAEALELLDRVGADAIQPYGERSAEVATTAAAAGIPVLLPVGVAGDVPPLVELDGVVPLLDTAVDGEHGGTGQTFDWSIAAGLDGVIVAGGLTAENVAQAVVTAKPIGVDASSGLETEVGHKDHSKVADFVAAARKAAVLTRCRFFAAYDRCFLKKATVRFQASFACSSL